MYSSITQLTGGEIYIINGPMMTQDLRIQLCSQLDEMVLSTCACDAKMKIRCSRGVRFSEYIGKGHIDTIEDVIEICGWSKHDTFAFFLQHEGSRYF